jgi:hypothetical protein
MFYIAVNMESLQEMIDIFDTYVRTDLKLLGFAYYHPFPKHTELKIYEKLYRACQFNLADFPGLRVKDHPEVFNFKMVAWNDSGPKPPVSSRIAFFDINGQMVAIGDALNSELYLQEVKRLFYRDNKAKKAAEEERWSSSMSNDKIFDLFSAYTHQDLHLRNNQTIEFGMRGPAMNSYTAKDGYKYSALEFEMNKIPGLGIKDHPEVTKIQMFVWGERIPPPTTFDRVVFCDANGKPVETIFALDGKFYWNELKRVLTRVGPPTEDDEDDDDHPRYQAPSRSRSYEYDESYWRNYDANYEANRMSRD